MYENNEIKNIIAKNIAFYRKAKGLTQAELAMHLNYSDKAISKWERAESIPDIVVLKQLAEFFNITLDELTADVGHPENFEQRGRISKLLKSHKLIIPFLSAGLVWLAATIVFVILEMLKLNIERTYLAFIYAIPVSLIVLIVFNAIWGNRILSAIIVSLLVWSIPLSIFLTLNMNGGWLLFLISIPLQVLAVLWYIMRIRADKSKKFKKES